MISRLHFKGTIITDQKDILNEEKSYYENLFSKKDLKNTPYNFFNNVEKLDEIEQNMCDGLLTEHELATALKDMKNQKKPWIRRTYNRVLQTFLERY